MGRTAGDVGAGVERALRGNLHAPLTTFVGRTRETAEVARLVAGARLVTLTGSGGCGKTRLALRVIDELDDATPWLIDLAPVIDASTVPEVVVHALGLPDSPGVSALDAAVGALAGSEVEPVLVVDNCEHLVDAAVDLVAALLRRCPELRVIATSREPLGVDGEVVYRVPSLERDDATRLFVERAGRARVGFALDDRSRPVVEEICTRLDGIPLAIELAAARLRAFTPSEILDELHDRFRLLTGGARSAVPRQQTLAASVQWSYDLLTEPDRVLLRRCAVFSGSFDLAAAEDVAAASGLERHQVRDQLASLVDKSLVQTEDDAAGSRYWMLETVRQFAADHLADAGETEACRLRHRDHYLTSLSAVLSVPDLDNARVAMRWSLERGDVDEVIAIAQVLMPAWIDGRYAEGQRWFDDALKSPFDVDPRHRLTALTGDALLAAYVGSIASVERADEAVAVARTLDDPRTLAVTLHAAGNAHVFSSELAGELYGEGAAVAEAADLPYELACNLDGVGGIHLVMGRLPEARAAWERSLATLEAAGFIDVPLVFQELTFLAELDMMTGWLDDAIEKSERVARAHNVPTPQRAYGIAAGASALATRGDFDAADARVAEAQALIEGVGAAFFDINVGGQAAIVAAARGDRATASAIFGAMLEWSHQNGVAQALNAVLIEPLVPLALADGDLARAEVLVAELREVNALTSFGPYRRGLCAYSEGLLALAHGDPASAEDLAHEAITNLRDAGDRVGVCRALDVVAASLDDGRAVLAARVIGGVDAERAAIPCPRPPHEAGPHAEVVARLREAIGDESYEAAYAEGASLSRDELVTFATRRRGPRRRSTRGWPSLTSAELDVARLVAEGLANKEIATRLLVSPRTVQAHLTHIYAKLGITSRVQLAQYASQNG